MNKTSETFPI